MLSKSEFATLIPVRNMERAIRFYTSRLGGRLTNRAEGRMRNFWAAVRVGDEVVWLIRPQKRERRALAYSTFIVKNIRGIVRGLARKGVRFDTAERMGPDTTTEGPIAFGPMGASAFFRDSEGNHLMIWQNTGM